MKGGEGKGLEGGRRGCRGEGGLECVQSGAFKDLRPPDFLITHSDCCCSLLSPSLSCPPYPPPYPPFSPSPLAPLFSPLLLLSLPSFSCYYYKYKYNSPLFFLLCLYHIPPIRFCPLSPPPTPFLPIFYIPPFPPPATATITNIPSLLLFLHLLFAVMLQLIPQPLLLCAALFYFFSTFSLPLLTSLVSPCFPIHSCSSFSICLSPSLCPSSSSSLSYVFLPPSLSLSLSDLPLLSFLPSSPSTKHTHSLSGWQFSSSVGVLCSILHFLLFPFLHYFFYLLSFLLYISSVF